MAGLSIWHVLIFAIVVILLFGTSKLKNLGKDVGGAVKDFKKSMRDEDAANTHLNEPRTLEHEAQNKTNSSVQS
ncbi:Sec-independent protein translocase subunit TatA [Avibacterium paragallinarum]